jgi:hypothetical protein
MEGQTYTMAQRRRTDIYNGPKKKDRHIQWPKEDKSRESVN